MESTLDDKVRTFVDLWVQSHIRAEGYQAKGNTRLARALARKCVEMAQTEGISAGDIEAEFGDIIRVRSLADQTRKRRFGHERKGYR